MVSSAFELTIATRMPPFRNDSSIASTPGNNSIVRQSRAARLRVAIINAGSFHIGTPRCLITSPAE